MNLYFARIKTPTKDLFIGFGGDKSGRDRLERFIKANLHEDKVKIEVIKLNASDLPPMEPLQRLNGLRSSR